MTIGKLFEFATKPVQPEFSSSICLKVVIERKQFCLPVTNRDESKNETDICKSCVHKYTTSKRIELESPGCSGFEENLRSFQT